jgi:hypothetical protein
MARNFEENWLPVEELRFLAKQTNGFSGEPSSCKKTRRKFQKSRLPEKAEDSFHNSGDFLQKNPQEFAGEPNSGRHRSPERFRRAAAACLE